MSSARAWRMNSTASSRAIPGSWDRWSSATGRPIARQFLLPLVVWLHACIGLHFAWRLKSWYRAWLPALYAVALLVPVAGIVGAAIALRDVADLAQQPGFLENLFARVHAPPPADIANLYAISRNLQIGALGPARRRPRRAPAARTSGNDAPASYVSTTANAAASSQPAGLTILEMSRIAGIPACLGLRRARPLLDLPGAHRRRGSRQAAAGLAGRTEGAGARRRAGQCAAGLPAAPAARPLSRDAAPAGVGRPGRGLSPAAPGAWRRALCRRSCSPTSAASPRSRRASCPTTWCSCSTAISARPGRPSRRPAAGSTNSSATA